MSPDAPADEIRRAYLRLARRHHPDANATGPAAAREGAETHIRAINAAWTVLGHPARRREYDHSMGIGSARWRPLAGDEAEEDDEPDPRLAPDVPYQPGARQSGIRRLTTLAPMLLVLASVATFSFGVVAGSVALLAVAVGLLVLAGGLFVLVPLIYMSDARRHG